MTVAVGDAERDVWGHRLELAAAQWQARAAWSAMNDPRRVAVLELVGAQLVELVEHLDEWVPAAFELRDDGRTLVVTIELDLGELSDAEAEVAAAQMRGKATVVRRLADIERDLRA